MDVSKDADDADRCVLLLIHDLENQVDEELREDLKNKLRAEVLGGVGHDHRAGTGEQMEEALLIIALPEVDGQPVRDLLVAGGEVARLLDEGLQRDVVEVGLALLYQSSPRDLGDVESQTQLVLLVGQLRVETDQLLPDQLILLLDSLELLQ
jgi:hypothetical protein